MSKFVKNIAAGLLTALTVSIFANVAQADEAAGHGPPPFSVFDMDGNGSISESEFYSVRQQRMAARASEGGKMRCAKYAPSFEDIDTDSSGALSEQELTGGQKAHMAKCKEKGQGTGKGQGRMANMPAFSDFDVDGDGIIIESEFIEGHASRMAEMSAAGHHVKHADNAPDFSAIDTNGDGGISELEFSKHRSAHHRHKKGHQVKEK